MIAVCDTDPAQYAPQSLDEVQAGNWRALSRLITALENQAIAPALRQQVLDQAQARAVPVLGITGTGGSGKSSLTDELVRRFRWIRTIGSRSRSSPPIPRGARPAARCWATVSA